MSETFKLEGVDDAAGQVRKFSEGAKTILPALKDLHGYNEEDAKYACRRRATAHCGIGSTPMVDLTWKQFAEFMTEYNTELARTGLPQDADELAKLLLMAARDPDGKPFANAA